MNCEHEHKYLLYLWSEMDQPERAAFVHHLGECSACKGQVEQLESLVRSMQDVQIQELPQDVAQRVRGVLDQADKTAPPGLRITPRQILAVAASIVLLVGVSILWLSKPPGLEGVGPERVETTDPLLSDDDYIDALALVLISEPDDAGDLLTEAIEDVAYQIAELTQEIEDDLEPVEPNQKAPGKQGANRAAGKLRTI